MMRYYHIGNCIVNVDGIKYALLKGMEGVITIKFHDDEFLEVNMCCDTDAQLVEEFKLFVNYLSSSTRKY